MGEKSLSKKGWIESINDKEIYCCLRKKGELNHELFYGLDLLTKEQKDLICIGLLVKYDMKKETLKVLKETKSELIWV